MLHITPIKALDDNYIWCIKPSETARECYFVDFGDVEAARGAIQNQNLDLQGILITHHHWDHTDGIKEFIQTYKNSKGQAPFVFGNSADSYRLPPLTLALSDQSEFEIFDKKVRVFAVPGHTLGHLAYFIEDEIPRLFSGDTLFSAGCGRTFEGSSEQMYNSLSHLASLDEKTLVYPAHEYTLSNLKFAEFVEPKNGKIQEFRQQILELLAEGKASIPTLLKTELEINPFLRTNSKEIRNKLAEILKDESFKTEQSDNKKNNVEIFAHLRKLKDNFKG